MTDSLRRVDDDEIDEDHRGAVVSDVGDDVQALAIIERRVIMVVIATIMIQIAMLLHKILMECRYVSTCGAAVVFEVR